MGAMTWDPAQYARFADARRRPFVDLLARVGARDPRIVLDLGCGDGARTLELADRWPRSRVTGLDGSPEMLAAAREADSHARVEWVRADLEDWDPDDLGAPPDVVVTNATLQWVPRHLDLIRRVVTALAPGGWFAMQVPDNLHSPSHAFMREVAAAHTRSAVESSGAETATGLRAALAEAGSGGTPADSVARTCLLAALGAGPPPDGGFPRAGMMEG